jgi:hypothetical protein
MVENDFVRLREPHPFHPMKKLLLPVFLAVTTTLLSGCIGLHFGGGGSKSEMVNKSQTYDVTLGQQLLDLQKAHDAGVITDSEYNAQKKKLLRHYMR